MADKLNSDSSKKHTLILASSSPRRAQLLGEAGYDFSIVHPPVDEPSNLSAALPPELVAEALSYFKAQSTVSLTNEGLILGGDTVVALGDSIFGKPTGRENAGAILRGLCGTRHDVITGLTLLDAYSGRRMIRHDRTVVAMKPMSDQQIETYLDTGAWEGKAGAYGIQDHGDAFVERVEGSFTNVVGLPLELLEQMLVEWDAGAAASR